MREQFPSNGWKKQGFLDDVWSMFFNKGPEFLAGIPRHSHFRPYKLLAAVVIPGLLLVAALAPANGTSGATKS